MPLFIKFKNRDSVIITKFGESNNLYLHSMEVEFLSANGPEYAFILNKFTVNGQITIPFSDTMNIYWYGDTAKTILSVWPTR